jgi:two-component system cell cycle sensor histidine kinase/response regulator CckA
MELRSGRPGNRYGSGMRTTSSPDSHHSIAAGFRAPQTGRTPTILITEDTPEMRSFIRRILEGLGYRVLAAETAQEALAISDHYNDHIDLLVMDVVLPDMFGPAVACRIQERRPRTKALFISGFSTLPILDELIDEGVGFMHKPFVRGAFASKVREVLDAA